MNKKGFSLIELIIVIVLIGILSVVVVPRIFNSGYKKEGDVVKFITIVRFVQHQSMIYGGGCYIEFADLNTYCAKNVNGSVINLPGEGGNCVRVEGSIYAKVGNKSIKDIVFDYMGRPAYDNGSLIGKLVVVYVDGKKIYITPNAGGVYEP